ncbi:MAG: GNAT family N-acetyltransferase [Clostridia bacterium]|nr:GNAT family N-acetyltransferase [Clostridia bacterium]
MIIETGRLIVRTFREEDTDALYSIKTDPRVKEFCPDFLDVNTERADILDYIRTFQKTEERGDTDTWRCYAIESRETGKVMGGRTGSVSFSKEGQEMKKQLSIDE